MEKKKVSSRFTERQFTGCFSFLVFGCFGIIGLLVIIPTLYGKIPQNPLSPEIMPTAEALLDIPYTVTLSDDVGFYLDVRENYAEDFYGTTEDAICVRAWYADESKLTAFRNNSSLFIDDVWIIGASQTYVGWGGLEYGIELCALGELQSGIHLIEFHLKDSFWGEPIHIQQWAIEIE